MFHSPRVSCHVSCSWRYTGNGIEASFLTEHTTPTDLWSFLIDRNKLWRLFSLSVFICFHSLSVQHECVLAYKWVWGVCLSKAASWHLWYGVLVYHVSVAVDLFSELTFARSWAFGFVPFRKPSHCVIGLKIWGIFIMIIKKESRKSQYFSWLVQVLKLPVQGALIGSCENAKYVCGF